MSKEKLTGKLVLKVYRTDSSLIEECLKVTVEDDMHQESGCYIPEETCARLCGEDVPVDTRLVYFVRGDKDGTRYIVNVFPWNGLKKARDNHIRLGKDPGDFDRQLTAATEGCPVTFESPTPQEGKMSVAYNIKFEQTSE